GLWHVPRLAAPRLDQFLTPCFHQLIHGFEQVIVVVGVGYLIIRQEQLYPRTMLGSASFGQDVSQVIAVHHQNVIVFIEMVPVELLSALPADIDAVLLGYRDGAAVRWIADMPVTGA